METRAYEQFRDLEEAHWWFRGRRSVYLGLLRHWLPRYLDGAPVTRALDLGCGMGGFLPGLAELAEHVYPADISLESLAHCRSRGFDRGVVVDGYALPYADASFDLVCLFDTVEHVSDDLRAMREVRRVLRPGGVVFLSVPAYPFLYSNNDRVAQHERRYTRSSLRRLVEAAGFSLERNTHSNVLLFPLILPAVLAIKALEALSPVKDELEHTNLSWRLPAFVHALLHAAFASELGLSKHVDLPVGHSIAALARRPADGQSRSTNPSPAGE